MKCKTCGKRLLVIYYCAPKTDLDDKRSWNKIPGKHYCRRCKTITG